MTRLQAALRQQVSRLPDRRFFGWFSLALVADLGTKEVAARMLDTRMIDLGERFSLMLVYNTGGAGGYTLGPATWALNVAVTITAMLLMLAVAREVSRLHPLGAVALGLVTGGASGNLASMLFGPEGVADFIAVHLADRAIVFNVADLALWFGAVMLAPVIAYIGRLIREERLARVASA